MKGVGQEKDGRDFLVQGGRCHPTSKTGKEPNKVLCAQKIQRRNWNQKGGPALSEQKKN